VSVDVLDTEEAGGRIVRGGLLRSASYVGGILVGLVATPLLTRHLGPHGFGRYNTVTAITFVAVGLTESGLLAIGVREMSVRDRAGRLDFMRDYFGMRVVLIALAALAMTGFALAAGYPHVVVIGAAISAAGLIATTAYDICTVPLQVQLRLGWTAALELIRQLVTAVATVVLVVVGASIYPFFALVGLASAIAAVIAYGLVHADVPRRPRIDPRRWWSLLRDSIPFTVASAVAVVYFRVAVILTSLLSTAAQTGYFSLAFRVVELASGIPWLVVSSALPLLTRTAETDPERQRYAAQRLFEACAILGVGCALLIGVGAPVGVDIIGGHAFRAAVDPLRILGVTLIGTFLMVLWGQTLLALREHAVLLAANASALVVAVVLTLILVPTHGALGGAISTAATELWLAGVYLVMLVRRHPRLRPNPRVVGPLVLAAALGVAPAPFVPALPATFAAAAVFAVVLLALRAVPAELFEALGRRSAA
jgi:O-antigen/teichoic acid export membrane protein